MITRAKCLLIIIGDDETLCLDDNWRTLIEYCQNNEAFANKAKLHPRIEAPA